MYKKLFATLFALCLLAVLCTGRIYSGFNKGIAWNRGGLDVYPHVEVFLCEGNYNPSASEYTRYNVPVYLESLVADC